MARIFTVAADWRSRRMLKFFQSRTRLRSAKQKGHERNVRLAARIRREAGMSLKWIAKHLAMGSWGSLSNLPGAERKRESLKRENRHLQGTGWHGPNSRGNPRR